MNKSCAQSSSAVFDPLQYKHREEQEEHAATFVTAAALHAPHKCSSTKTLLPSRSVRVAPPVNSCLHRSMTTPAAAGYAATLPHRGKIMLHIVLQSAGHGVQSFGKKRL